MINFLRTRFFLVVIGGAILVGIFYVAPQILICKNVAAAGKSCQIFQFLTHNDESKGDFNRAREVYDGHFPPNDLFADESKPIILNPFPPLLFSSFFWMFGNNINLVYGSAEFLLAAIIFVLLYFLGWTITKSRLWSLFFGFLGAL